MSGKTEGLSSPRRGRLNVKIILKGRPANLKDREGRRRSTGRDRKWLG